MGMGTGNTLLWKTVTLDSDRTTDGLANTAAWASFLGINELTDLDKYVYVALFSNNTYDNYPADLICWTQNKSGNNVSPNIRADWTNAGTGTRSLFANAGTRIDVYKLPKYN